MILVSHHTFEMCLLGLTKCGDVLNRNLDCGSCFERNREIYVN